MIDKIDMIDKIHKTSTRWVKSTISTKLTKTEKPTMLIKNKKKRLTKLIDKIESKIDKIERKSASAGKGLILSIEMAKES